jgi:hypothetical protein
MYFFGGTEMNKLLLVLTLFVATLLLTSSAMACTTCVKNTYSPIIKNHVDVPIKNNHVTINNHVTAPAIPDKNINKFSVPTKFNQDHAGCSLKDYKKAVSDWKQYKKDNKNQGSNCNKNTLTCEQALASGLLSGTISGTTATVTNNAGKDFKVSFASYNMYAALIDDQKLFDSSTQTAKAGQTTQFNIGVPSCGYQVDLVCGDVIQNAAPYYNIASMIDTSFVNQDNYCTQTGSDNNKYSATITIASGFPQGNNYVFYCEANGFTATSYNWYFGDGQIQVAASSDNVYHTYTSSGSYTVSCRPTDGTISAVDTLTVNVS